MTAIVTGIYIVLLIIFLGASFFIYLHTVKFSYLSPRFKTVVSIFGILALAVIIFSMYLVFSLLNSQPSSSPLSAPSTTSTSDIKF